MKCDRKALGNFTGKVIIPASLMPEFGVSNEMDGLGKPDKCLCHLPTAWELPDNP